MMMSKINKGLQQYLRNLRNIFQKEHVNQDYCKTQNAYFKK